MSSRGRPKSFNNFDALEKAMQVFWEKGYEGASMCNLLCAMGISRQSLYNTFGNKRDLFIQCLQFYIHSNHQKLKDMLAGPGHAEAKLTNFFSMMQEAFSTKENKGCFVSSTIQEMAQKDAEVKRILDQKYAQNTELFQKFFSDAISSGQINSPLSGKDLAQLFDTLLLGVTGLCKLPDREDQIKNVFSIFLKQLNFVHEKEMA